MKGFPWFSLDKFFFSFKNDIFLCGACIPPRNTIPITNPKADFFGNLEKLILKYVRKGTFL